MTADPGERGRGHKRGEVCPEPMGHWAYAQPVCAVTRDPLVADREGHERVWRHWRPSDGNQ
jgi:hypothetical protein